MNKTDLALLIMQESLDAGFWWEEDYLRSDTGLASPQNLPEFNRKVEISEQRRQAVQKEANSLYYNPTFTRRCDSTHTVAYGPAR